MEGNGCEKKKKLTFLVLLVQAIATSIDALSVGFTISDYLLKEAIVSVCIIAGVTFIICLGGVFFGISITSKLGSYCNCEKSENISCKAEIFGGIILVIIGLEIFISNMFF